MPSLRDLRRRVRSVESTQQITRAMKMVAASKLRRTEGILRAFRPYSDGYAESLARFSREFKSLRNPLLSELEEPILTGKIGLILVTSDRGLCGGFNNSLMHRAADFMRQHSDADITSVAIGRKGRNFFRKTTPRGPTREYVQLLEDLTFDVSHEILRELLQLRQEFGLEAIHIIYSNYRSAISQQVVAEQLMPIQAKKQESEQKSLPYIFEPDPESALDAVLERSLTIKLHRALLESLTSEYGARMTAMDNATENAGELIEHLTLLMNRARQTAITSEILDIIGGAEALQ